MWLTGASLSELAFFVSAVNNGLGYIYWIIYVFFYISVTSQHRASVSKHVPFNTFQYVVTWVSLNENKLLIGSMRTIIFSPIMQLCCDKYLVQFCCLKNSQNIWTRKILNRNSKSLTRNTSISLINAITKSLTRRNFSFCLKLYMFISPTDCIHDFSAPCSVIYYY